MLKKNIRLLYLLSFLQGMVFYGPIATLYRQARGVTIGQITLIESINLGLSLLLEIPWGVVADKIGYKRTFVFCTWLYFASKLVFWQAEGFGWFLAERLMLSVVIAGLSGVDSTILYLSCGRPGTPSALDSQKAFGVWDSMGTAGLLFASVVFSVWVKENYSLAAFLTVLSYGAAALLALGIADVKAPAPSDEETTEGFGNVWKEIFQNRSLILFLAAGALLGETHQTITVFLNQLQYEACGMTSGVIGLVYIAATLLGMAGQYSSEATHKLGLPRALFGFSGCAAAACLVLAFTRSAGVSVGAILLLRVSHSLLLPLRMQIQNQSIQTQNRATALSVQTIFTDGIAVGTNLAFGQLAERTLPGAFLFGAGISGLSVVLLAVWYHAHCRKSRAAQ